MTFIYLRMYYNDNTIILFTAGYDKANRDYMHHAMPFCAFIQQDSCNNLKHSLAILIDTFTKDTFL